MSLQITDESGLGTSQEGKTRVLPKEKTVKSGNIFFRAAVGLLCLLVVIAGGGMVILSTQGKANSRIFIWFGAAVIAALVALAYLLKMKK